MRVIGSVTRESAHVRRDGRLALYLSEDASVDFWTRNWMRISDSDLRRALRPTRRLSVHRCFFSRHLPRNGVVIEAGCGTGLWVRRLCENGWNCVGLDYSVDGLSRSRRVATALPLLGGDVFRLPFADGSIAGYVSFGVVEHFINGPKAALLEACRVLRRGGVALISVPFDNRMRRRIETTHEQEALDRGLKFYQYYFSYEDFQQELRSAGFTPMNVFHGYAVSFGGHSSLPLLSRIFHVLRRTAVLDWIPGFPRLAAHMMFTCALKP